MTLCCVALGLENSFEFSLYLQHTGPGHSIPQRHVRDHRLVVQRLPLEGKCLSCGQVARKVPDEVDKRGFPNPSSDHAAAFHLIRPTSWATFPLRGRLLRHCFILSLLYHKCRGNRPKGTAPNPGTSPMACVCNIMPLARYIIGVDPGASLIVCI